MSKSIPKNRRAAFNNQGGLCYYCGFPMWLSEPDRFAVAFKIGKGDSSRFQCTAEHLVAKQNGGGNSAVNVVAACRFVIREGTAVPHRQAHQHIRRKFRSD